MSSNLDKIHKIYALYKQGVGGEKRNAEALLKNLLKKSNLTLKDYEAEYHFRVEKDKDDNSCKDDDSLLFWFILLTYLVPILTYLTLEDILSQSFIKIFLGLLLFLPIFTLTFSFWILSLLQVIKEKKIKIALFFLFFPITLSWVVLKFFLQKKI